MTPEEHQELLQCSERIAQLLYKDACEQNRSISNLGAIEATVRAQIQEYVSPTIGAFFVESSVGQQQDIPVR